MPTVLVSENGADESIEIPELVAALDSYSVLFGPYHPQTIAVANRLAIAFWRAGDINQAVGLLDQALAGSSLAANGDLAVVLFELGDTDEAERLEGPARENARTHLGKTHPVRCVLANRQFVRCSSSD